MARVAMQATPAASGDVAAAGAEAAVLLRGTYTLSDPLRWRCAVP